MIAAVLRHRAGFGAVWSTARLRSVGLPHGSLLAWLLLGCWACWPPRSARRAIDTRARPADAPFWPQWRGPNRDDISPDTGL